jgi:hypothetical protein
LRTHIAFGAIVVIGLAWTGFAWWVLANRRVMLANQCVIASWMALAFSRALSDRGRRSALTRRAGGVLVSAAFWRWLAPTSSPRDAVHAAGRTAALARARGGVVMTNAWTLTAAALALSALTVSSARAQAPKPAVDAVAFEIGGGESIPAERGSFTVPKNRTAAAPGRDHDAPLRALSFHVAAARSATRVPRRRPRRCRDAGVPRHASRFTGPATRPRRRDSPSINAARVLSDPAAVCPPGPPRRSIVRSIPWRSSPRSKRD